MAARKDYAGTAEAVWFADAATARVCHAAVERCTLAGHGSLDGKVAEQLRAAISEQRKHVTTAEFLAAIDADLTVIAAQAHRPK